MNRNSLIQEIDALLKPATFKDFAPNGLQIEGKTEIKTIITGVTASLALLEQAVSAGADMVLVHHGYFWNGEDRRIIHNQKQRIATLLKHDINLVAYHLPLDAHPEIGNNAQLANLLGFKTLGTLDNPYIFYGELSTPISPEDLQQKIHQTLNRKPLLIKADKKLIKSIVWCTGAAQKYLTEAAIFGADAYLSGEISESTTHTAREMNIHYFACGHHATERYGIQALGEHLAEQFNLKHQFIEIDNPV